MNETSKFEVEVLTRLAVIESKLDGYKELKSVAYEGNNRSIENEKRIIDLEDRNKWLARVAIGAIIGEIIGIGFMIFSNGIGG